MKIDQHDRRQFLKKTSLGLLGAGLISGIRPCRLSSNQEDMPRKITGYRTLGRTGFKVSTLGFGRPTNPAVLRAGIQSGINYFDTAPGYSSSQQDIGSIIHEFDRKSVFITTKVHASALGDKDHILGIVRKSLETLKVDYVDCFQMQGADSLEMVKHQGFHEAYEQLKQEGRVRFCGIACHGSYFPGNPEDTMENILLSAIDDGRFDLLLVVYNFLHFEQGERVLRAAAGKNIATTIMKSNPVKMFNMFKEYEAQYKANGEDFPERWKPVLEAFKGHNEKAMQYIEEQGIVDHDELLRDVATRFVLDNEQAHCVLIDFRSFDDLESHIRYAGDPLTADAREKLEFYRKIFSAVHCRIGCNACQLSCPHNVPVNTILRYHYYFAVKQQEKYAMEKYRDLPGNKPDVCGDCPGYCEKACPHDILTRPLLAMAHQDLSFKNPHHSTATS
jgi:predicted aldo/keto reductase-like oxidoreductase